MSLISTGWPFTKNLCHGILISEQISGYGTLPNKGTRVCAANAQEVFIGGRREGQEGAEGEDGAAETNETELTHLCSDHVNGSSDRVG